MTKLATFLFCCLLLMAPLIVCAQSHVETTAPQDLRKMKPASLLHLMALNPAAYKQMKIAKSNNDIATVFGFAGGFLIGWSLGTLAGGGDFNPALAGGGAALIGCAIPFSIAYSKHRNKAIRYYTGTEAPPSACGHINIHLGSVPGGIGLVAHF